MTMNPDAVRSIAITQNILGLHIAKKYPKRSPNKAKNFMIKSHSTRKRMNLP